MKKIIYTCGFIFLAIFLSASAVIQNGNPDFFKKILEKLNILNKNYTVEKIYLFNDKPIYKPGKTIWFSIFVLNGATHKPSDKSDVVYAELIDPKGNTVQKLTLPVINGLSKGNFDLNTQTAGGQYTLRAYTNWCLNFGKDYIFEKSIIVQKIINPVLLLKLEFAGKAYGKGSLATANLEVKNLSNEILANQEFEYIVTLKGAEFIKQKQKTDADGKAKIEFKLPENLTTTDGLLNIIIKYKESTESVSRSIPIVLNKIDLKYYPEGGNFVADVKNRIAFEALNEFGKPADIKGEILDNDNNKVADFESFHAGMGACEFTPAAGKKYFARLTYPVKSEITYELPVLQENIFALHLLEKNSTNLKFSYFAPYEQTVYFIGCVRDNLVFSKKETARKGLNEITIPLHEIPQGIFRFTLFNQDSMPQCERLVYTGNQSPMNIELTTNKKNYNPYDTVRLKIKTTDQKKNPVRAKLSISVTNDKTTKLANDKQNNILSYCLMSTELKGKIDEPAFYFSKDEPKAEKALDYVLLTHGWRRFVWKEINKPLPKINYVAENTGMIGGTVKSYKTNNPVKAKVYLMQAGSLNKMAMAQTTENGNFIFLNILPNLNYVLLIEPENLKGNDVYADLTGNIQENFNQMISEIAQNKEEQENTAIIDKNKKNENNQIAEDKQTEEQRSLKEKISDIADNVTDAFESNKSTPRKESQKISGPVSGIKMETEDVEVSECVVTAYGISKEARALSGSIVTVRDMVLLNSDLEIGLPGINVLNNNVYQQKQQIDLFGIPALNIPQNHIITTTDNLPVKFFNSNLNYAFLQQQSIGDLSVIYSPLADKISSTQTNIGLVNLNTRSTYNRYVLYFNTKSPDIRSQYINSKRSFSPVREFYVERDGNDYTVRSEDIPQLLFIPEIITNENGEAEIEFSSSEELSTYNIIAEGFSQNGDIGRGETKIASILEMSMDAKIPPVLCFGDTTVIPLRIINNTKNDLQGTLKHEFSANIKPLQNIPEYVLIPAGSVFVQNIPFYVMPEEGKGFVKFSYTTSLSEDNFYKSFDIVKKGFPVNFSISNNKQINNFEFEIEKPIAGSVKAKFQLMINPVTVLLNGLENMLREPYGCFEQVSSVNFPNIMVLQYLRRMNLSKPEIESKSLAFLQNGYNKIAGYEANTGGFDWYGRSPGNEALTAYGIWQLTEMKKVCNFVDNELIMRTSNWLLSRRDGNGGFKLNQGMYGFSQASHEVSCAYIVFALAESGNLNLITEYNAAFNEAISSNDAYRLALMANASFCYGYNENGNKTLSILRTLLKQNGCGKLKASQSMVCAYGNALQIEIASLILLAELKSKQPDLDVLLKLSEYILANRATCYSTHATILSLKALIELENFNIARQNSKITLKFKINNIEIEKTVSPQIENIFTLDNLEKYLTIGKQKISVEIAAENPVPYVFNCDYTNYNTPANNSENIELNTGLLTKNCKVGETVRLTAILKNKSQSGVPQTVAIIGIPSGLSVQPWQLKEFVQKQLFDYYEIIDNKLILYYAELAPKAIKELNFDLKADVSGYYEAPASSGYIYYNNEQKSWNEGLKIKIDN